MPYCRHTRSPTPASCTLGFSFQTFLVFAGRRTVSELWAEKCDVGLWGHACRLVVWKHATPRNRIREIFTSGSVGGLVE